MATGWLHFYHESNRNKWEDNVESNVKYELSCGSPSSPKLQNVPLLTCLRNTPRLQFLRCFFVVAVYKYQTLWKSDFKENPKAILTLYGNHGYMEPIRFLRYFQSLLNIWCTSKMKIFPKQHLIKTCNLNLKLLLVLSTFYWFGYSFKNYFYNNLSN